MSDQVWSKLGFEKLSHPDRFGLWLGYQLDSVDRKTRKITASLKIREEHLSPSGRVHGGVVSAFLDFASGAAVFSALEKKESCSTVEIKVNYLKPLDLGDELQAKTEVVYKGKKLCVVLGRLFRNGTEEVIGLSTGTFNIIKPKAP